MKTIADINTIYSAESQKRNSKKVKAKLTRAEYQAIEDGILADMLNRAKRGDDSVCLTPESPNFKNLSEAAILDVLEELNKEFKKAGFTATLDRPTKRLWVTGWAT